MADSREVTVVEEAPMVIMSERAIDNIVYNATMAERMVTSLLEKDIDYGRTPGTQSDGLWDAGAAKIINSFNCYVDHQVLFQRDEENLISWCIQANVVSRTSQTIVGTGVGAASTKETKYKYRWAYNPKEYGYTPEEIKKLKFKDGKYRIINPEYGELVNTLFLMAAKRAEVDAARAMPGVGGALKKMFDGKIAAEESGAGNKPWAPFYAMVGRMGLTSEEAKAKLGVKSMKDWKGSVDDAILKLASVVSMEMAEKAGVETPPVDEEPPAADEIFQEEAVERNPEGEIPERTPDDFKETIDLLRICSEDFHITKVNTVFKELGYANQAEFEATKPYLYNSYLEIKALYTKESRTEE